MAPPIDPHIGDRVVAWYQRWPTAAKVAFWVLGGGVIVVIVASAIGLRTVIVYALLNSPKIESATVKDAGPWPPGWKTA